MKANTYFGLTVVAFYPLISGKQAVLYCLMSYIYNERNTLMSGEWLLPLTLSYLGHNLS